MLHFLKKIKKNNWRYHYFTPMYQKSQWYDLQFLRCRVWQTEIGNFRPYLPFYPPKTPKKQNFEKMKKIAGDIVILHMYTKNYTHMMFGSWDAEWDRENVSLIWAIFYPFPPLTFWKMKILKTWEERLEILFFTNVYHKWQLHHVWFLKCGVQRTEFFVLLDHFSPFYPTNDPQNHNFQKMKTHLEELFYTCVQSYNQWQSYDVRFRRYGARWTEIFFILDHFFPILHP